MASSNRQIARPAARCREPGNLVTTSVSTPVLLSILLAAVTTAPFFRQITAAEISTGYSPGERGEDIDAFIGQVIERHKRGELTLVIPSLLSLGASVSDVITLSLTSPVRESFLHVP
jgi:hypothetical protein